MEIRELRAAEIEAAHQFLCSQGWDQRLRDAAEFKQLIANTQRTAVAVVDGRIIGFARGITDGISNGYLSMIAVAAEHRRQGIGSLLVRHIMGDNPKITWVLRAGRENANAFFSKLGFVVSTVTMERVRTGSP